MEKIRGITRVYDPESKEIKDIEIEAEIDWEWDERKGVFYPWASAKCPYDGEDITFEIIFSDNTYFPNETYPAGNCVHFSSDAFTYDDSGLLFVKETPEEFAEKMGWDLRWVGNPGKYYVFVPKEA